VIRQLNNEAHKSACCQDLGMKYTARHIRRFLEQGRIDPVLWQNHFPSLLPSQVPSCEDCEAQKARTCPGGRDPVECFLSVRNENENGLTQEKGPAPEKKKPKDPMLGVDSRRKKPSRVANKTYDQSKM